MYSYSIHSFLGGNDILLHTERGRSVPGAQVSHVVPHGAGTLSLRGTINRYAPTGALPSANKVAER